MCRILRSRGCAARRSAAAALTLGVLLVCPAGRARPVEDQTVPHVAKGDFRPALVLTGSLTALRSEEFKVPITESWRIQIKWMVKEGDSVKAGDPVVRFDTANLASQVESNDQSLRTKREEKAQKEADYRFQKFELDVEVKKAENDVRLKEIDASIPKGIESRQEYDRKQLERKRSDHGLETAETNQVAKLAQTDGQIKTLGVEIDELEAKQAKLRRSLEELTLYARAPGAVIYGADWTGRKVQVGDTVYATRKIAEIPDLSSLQVQAWVSETHVQQIAAGEPVDLYLDAYPERKHRGIIREVSKSAEAIRNWGKSNYFRADIEMDKLDTEIMKPGMSVKCEVVGPLQKDVLLVPLEMTAFDGQAFWIRPVGGQAVSLAPLGFNEFVVAATPEKNPKLKIGLALAPVGALENKPEKKDGEKK
jgi:multidrug efflux pump subunit AcrA (membrane-fusion protein)